MIKKILEEVLIILPCYQEILIIKPQNQLSKPLNNNKLNNNNCYLYNSKHYNNNLKNQLVEVLKAL